MMTELKKFGWTIPFVKTFLINIIIIFLFIFLPSLLFVQDLHQDRSDHYHLFLPKQ